MVFCILMLCRDFIVSMETHITTERDLLVTFLTNVRSWYATGLCDKNRSKASEDGTVLGIIDEVSYMYIMYYMCVRTHIFLVQSWRLSTNCLFVCLCVCLLVCLSACLSCLPAVFVCVFSVCFLLVSVCLFVHL